MLIYNDYFPNYGVPYGIRTRVTAVRGRCPGPLDEGDAAVAGWACFSPPFVWRQDNYAFEMVAKLGGKTWLHANTKRYFL